MKKVRIGVLGAGRIVGRVRGEAFGSIGVFGKFFPSVCSEMARASMVHTLPA